MRMLNFDLCTSIAPLLIASPFMCNPPHRPVVPMEYMGEEYFKLKASIIKYERFVLKVRQLTFPLVMSWALFM